MSLILAIKSFIKAWNDPAQAKIFLDETPKRLDSASADHSHLRLLALLQQTGRLIDFFKEDIHDFTDAQIGAAVRQIHQDCSKSLEEARDDKTSDAGKGRFNDYCATRI